MSKVDQITTLAACSGNSDKPDTSNYKAVGHDFVAATEEQDERIKILA